MGRHGFGVFVSYRREDASGYAGRLHEAVARHFYDDDVFIDIASVEPGADFVDAINETLAKCRVVLALIGPHWLNAVSTEGTRRLDDPADFVRLELETALDWGKRVIPVLVQGARMPTETDLPPSLAALCRRQALELFDPLWSESLARLIESVEESLGRPSQRNRGDMSADRHAGAMFRVLGPLEVRVGDRAIALGGAKQRSLLALLLTEVNHVVPVARMVEALWGEDADDAASNSLHRHVSSLRKAVAPAAAALGVDELVCTQRPGYVVHLTAAELDLLAFRELVASAQRVAAAHDVRAAAEKYREALALVH
nr:TIR domain-containing protein [Actinomycetota bacterium]